MIESAGMEALFFIDFHQNNIVPHLIYAFPGDNTFGLPSEQSADASGSRDDQRDNASGFAVNVHISRTTKGLTGADIYDFLLFQFA